MSQDVYIVGVGMIPFTKPGANQPYPQMAAQATNAALTDAGIGYELVQQAYVGYVYGDSTCRPARAVRGGPDRHSGRQRQQQLLHRLDRAVPGAPGGGAAAPPTACWRSASSRCSPGALGAVFDDRPSPFDALRPASPTSWSGTSRACPLALR